MKKQSIMNSKYMHIIEGIICNHSSTMSVLIGSDFGKEDYKVLYANRLAVSFFLNQYEGDGYSFFGSLWFEIHKELQHLSSYGLKRKKIMWMQAGEQVTFELSIQKILSENQSTLFFLELYKTNPSFNSKVLEGGLLTKKVHCPSHLEFQLDRAIERNELQIHYQPQVNLQTGEVQSFEALLRWHNKQFGVIPPSEFIPIAERTGLIQKIGDWIIEEVCKQLNVWKANQFPSVRIAINISAKQFQEPFFVKKIQDKLREYRVSPNELEMEITESILMDGIETSVALKALERLGIKISVDDFGTGYSSLSYLKNYPIDIIKIDRLFVKDLELDKKAFIIVEMIINLAHSLNMEVIAEGVESKEQAEILRKANCQKAQGFLFSKAIPPNEVVKHYFQ